MNDYYSCVCVEGILTLFILGQSIPRRRNRKMRAGFHRASLGNRPMGREARAPMDQRHLREGHEAAHRTQQTL